MNADNTSNGDFLNSLQEIIQKNLKDPEFGVSVLAREAGMSRSNLHRKVFALAKISVSQFIRQERLEAGLKLLKHTSSTVSEIAYEVGFNNVSYFIKCFHDYYGYSPGEVGKREKEVTEAQTSSKRKIKPGYIAGALITIVLAISYLIYANFNERNNGPRTVAILPLLHEIEDSSYYVSRINGTIQNVIDNLNLIEDLKVIPWGSVLQYKNSTKPLTEIANELNVTYVVRPSILTDDNKIQLKIPIIEGQKNNQFWTENYEIDINDLTTIYQKISKEIAGAINARITPAEKNKIEKPITTNGTALNYYNAGMQYRILSWGYGNNKKQSEYLGKAIVQFEKALDYDYECASAWAQLCNIYSMLYLYYDHSAMYKNNIFRCAAQAMLYDPNLDKSLYSMALSLKVNEHFQTAKLFLEKALKYNPNFAYAYVELSELSSRQHITNPESVEYALKALRYTTNDSIEMGEVHSSAATALRNAGLYQEALYYIDKAIKLNPTPIHYYREKSEILILKERNVDSAIKILNELNQLYPDYTEKDYLFKDLFLKRDYQKAYTTFKKFYELSDDGKFKKNKNPRYRNLQRFVVLLDHLGYKKEYDLHKKILLETKNTTLRTGPYYDPFEMIRSYCINNEPNKAMQELQNFSKQEYFLSNHIYLLEFSPFYDLINGKSEYKEILKEIKTKFEANRDHIREMIKEKGLL